MYWTYGIFDPRDGLCVYVGQTNDFFRRREEHLTKWRELKRAPKKGSVQEWLKQTDAAKIKPIFMVLEVVEMEGESLTSESKWIEKFASIGHPLRNLWAEHKRFIKSGRSGQNRVYDVLLFEDGKKPSKIGTMTRNAKGTGFAIDIPKGQGVYGPCRLDAVAKRSARSQSRDKSKRKK